MPTGDSAGPGVRRESTRRCGCGRATVAHGRSQRSASGDSQLTGRRIPIGRVLGHAGRDDVVERDGYPVEQLTRPRRRLGQVRANQHAHARGGERRSAGEAFVQHAGQRVHVGAMRDRADVEAFGRHVDIGADRHPGLGHRAVTLGVRDAEVGEVGEIGGRHQDVGGLHIAMHQAAGVGGVQRRGDLLDDSDRAVRAHRPAPTQHSPQVVAGHQAHVDEEDPVDHTPVVDRDDMRFGQLGRGLGFAAEPELIGRVLRELLRQQLQSDHSIFAGVVGLVDLAHPALAQHRPQLVRGRTGPRP